METWRVLFSTGVLILFWAGIVTALGEPPGPVSIAVATVLGGVGIYVSDIVIQRYIKPYADDESGTN